MLLKGQWYTRQRVSGLSHIFTLALQSGSQRDFYMLIYVLIGREDSVFATELICNAMQSPVDFITQKITDRLYNETRKGIIDG